MTEALYKRLRDMVDVLTAKHAYLAAAVLRLGAAHFTDEIDTAAIVASGQDVWLFFNPAFLQRLDDTELPAVLIHEAMHFLLQHHIRTAALSSQSDRFLFKFCCDAVINDLIV